MKKEIGIMGLGVMGCALARNFGRKGISLALYNRHLSGSEVKVALRAIQEHPELKEAKGFEEVKEFIEALERPRKIILMVTAGEAVDHLLSSLSGLLHPGDLIIDGGNSDFKSTEKRLTTLSNLGILFLGLGVSGGEEGALNGPSLMAGGSREAYELAHPYLSQIAAVTPSNNRALAYFGSGGSGHFVKMVHNAIEYAEMQLIAEAYLFLRNALGMKTDEIGAVFDAWMASGSNSYLLEITSEILRTKDEHGFVLDRIAPIASYNKTGASTLIEGALSGQPLSMVASALFSRFISNQKSPQAAVSSSENTCSKSISIETLHKAYTFARIVNHYQHFSMINAFAHHYQWDIKLNDLCEVWSAGCIIRSSLLNGLAQVRATETPMFFNSEIQSELSTSKEELKAVLNVAYQSDIALPGLSNALNYYLQLTADEPSAALVQAQRDYFGAHGVYFKEKANRLVHYPWNA